MKRRILIVEDEPSLSLSLRDRLVAEGYEVETAEDGDAGYAKATAGPFDLLVLDVMLPGRDGFDLCRDLRRQGVSVPILMLTARSQVVDKVLGLKLGADDYLTKPFEMIELTARIETLLRRSPATHADEPGVVTFGEVRVDFRKAEVHRAGNRVEISAMELKLLRFLVERRGEVLDRNTLLDEVWGYDATPFTRTVDMHVAALRRKLEENPSHPLHILTVRGMGYKFVG